MNIFANKIEKITLVLAGMLLLLAIPAYSQTQAWTEDGIASWYGGEFQGRVTASGETFDTNQLTAAHRTLPFGTRVVVTNLSTGASTTVRINDRGPFVAGRLIDLSQAAARSIDLVASGTARVRLSLPQAQDASASTLQAPTAKSNAPVEARLVSVAPPQTIAQTVAPAGPKTIQIASFSSQINARNLIDSLTASGLAASLETTTDNAVWRVVMVGVEPSRVEAIVDKLRTLGFGRVLVRQH